MNIRPCNVTGIEARYIDCCLSDYFLGSDAEEVLAVPVHAGMTCKQAYEACKDEVHASSGWVDDVDVALAEDALALLFSGMGDSSQPADFAKHIEEDEDGYTLYLYIGLHAKN